MTRKPEMTKNTKQTSPKTASIAAKLLRNPSTPANVKKVAASDLGQARLHPKKK
jgi:hypothetical protein